MLVISNWRGSFKEVHIALLLPRKWQLLSVGFGDHIAVLSSNLLGTISHIQFGGQVITIHLSASQCCDTFSSQDPLDFRDGKSCSLWDGSWSCPTPSLAASVPWRFLVPAQSPRVGHLCWSAQGTQGALQFSYLLILTHICLQNCQKNGILKRKKTQCLELTHFPN